MTGTETAASWMTDFDLTRPELRRRMLLRRLVLVLDVAAPVFVVYTVGGFVQDRIDSLATPGPAVADPPSWLGYAILVAFAALIVRQLAVLVAAGPDARLETESVGRVHRHPALAGAA